MVKVLFDTSVLVAAFVKAHPQHSIAAQWWKKVNAGEIQGIVSTHSLAEVYAVLTRLPIQPRINPKIAQQMIQENLKDFQTVPLTSEDYHNVISEMVALNLTGGAIYDALIAQIAKKENVDCLLTFNPNHFTRLSEDIAQRVNIPL